ncbi:MAG: sulfatase [Flavobacteriaceae bacterium]
MRHQLLILFALLLFGSCKKISQENRPNVIVINVDDMGWKDVGYMGSQYYETPNIDHLAKQGMIFTNGYASAANCAPSRACLMTGKWTPRHGIYTVGKSDRGSAKQRKIIPIQNTTTLSKDHSIIPEILNKIGYATCHSGKWHLSENPLEYGFELNIGGGHNGHPKSYLPPYQNVKIEGAKNQYLTDLIMEKTLEFIDTVNEPFFLNYAPYAVHTPIQPINDLLQKYDQKRPSNGQSNSRYATMVENLDRNIGLLISKLKEKNRFDRTLIVFTSDNGGLFGITNQHPLRAGKGSYYEGGIREPFFFVLKDRIRANSTSNIPITHLDLFPTILDYTGLKTSNLKFDGNSITPVLEEKVDTLIRPLFWHFPIYLQAYNKINNQNRDSLFRTRPGSVVRYGEWKLHYYFEENEVELYNLANDVGEREDLSLMDPEKTKEMLNLLKKWWNETHAPIPSQLNPEFEVSK